MVKSHDMQNAPKDPLDKVTLIDTQDNVLGEMDKIEAHRGEGKLHRASSVYLFRQNPNTNRVEVLFQKRSQHKIVGASQWGNTVCGNVRPIENYTECAFRRLKEELGIVPTEQESLDITDSYSFLYHLKCNAEFSEHELDHVFLGKWDGEIQLNPQEVEETIWVDWQNLLDEVASLGLTEFPQEGVVLTEHKIVVNPWTLWMLSDPKLLEVIHIFIKTI